MHKTLPYRFNPRQLIVLGLIVYISAGGCYAKSPAAAAPPTQFLTETQASSPEMSNFTPTAESKLQPITPHISPYVKVTVERVEVRYLEVTPVQVELVITGTLPDQCQYEFYSIENRTDQTVKVSLDGIHPADTSCLQVKQTIKYILPLGQDLPENDRGFAPGEYKLSVNKYETRFTVKE